MPRYIDADALKDKYHDKMVELIKCTTSNISEEALSLLCGCTLIDDIPTAAVEVVRCKDCKHLVRSEGVCKVLTNNYEPPVYVDDDDFCSRGERRDDD